MDSSQHELEAVLQRCDAATAATAGPWLSLVEGRDHDSGSNIIQTAGQDIELSGATTADQDFIASAKQDIPRLVALIATFKGLQLA